MRLKIALSCMLFAFSAVAATPFAQAPGSFTLHGNPTMVSQDIGPGTQIATFTGTTTAQINGIAIKDVTFSAYVQTTPSETKVWGVIVGNLASGDQVYIVYQRVSAIRNRVTQVGTLTYKIVGGTGAIKGITGSGTCKLPLPTATGTEDACAGTYAIP